MKRPTIGEALREQERRKAERKRKAAGPIAKAPVMFGDREDRVMICRGFKPGLAFIHVAIIFESDSITMTGPEMTKERAVAFAVFLGEKFGVEPEDFA